jgi:transposase
LNQRKLDTASLDNEKRNKELKKLPIRDTTHQIIDFGKEPGASIRRNQRSEKIKEIKMNPKKR